ncbi:error-prone DNA polymerase [Gluconobacter kanchanaburiensis]|uniref:Error-prone DNA polymerase n=1 Tax=Gluconobacter kanchanaburiensis NBRC 103587 TaxID=1307948 RepID=A0A511BAK3_9PROT|nr:error-prone DNA polymerase [Gluconobacter kanchanaburiensis]MBF0863059.1 error-prone DNA polymerase [Gluconobacter kanchanaburiensis]GBR71486.1 DNA polymerase III subunit alpha [Gluconobacter kanchanaburiensis NBRC 103587]GEK97446.1 error-prone DNA polymerase 1 [Gluconobacter kanchanaburiensis NBRC 103587]
MMSLAPPYAELQVTTYFSFLRGASSPIELFEEAKSLGIEALGICDRNSLAGMVQAHVAAKATGIRLVVGCRLDFADFPPVLAYPTDRAAYGRLCRLLTIGKARAGKGTCHLVWDDLVHWGEGLLVILIPDVADDACALHLRKLKDIFSDRAFMALTLLRRPNDQMRIYELANLAHQARVPTVVTNDVLFHTYDRRILQDVVTCIRHNTTIDDAGFARERHADRYLKPPEEMARLFSRYPEAVARSVAIMELCRFSLDDLAYQYPDEVSVPGQTPQQALEGLTWEGADSFYPEGIPEAVRRSLHHELALIARMDYAPYFLTVHSIVRYARSQGILCQGRGSAANSAVCYVLGVTAIDPARNNLLFERFISEERREPPDIDVDFEHARREEVLQWVYNHYGRDRAALTAVVTRYRAKGALRDVGKVMGLPEDLIRTLSGQIWGWGLKLETDTLTDTGIDPSDRRVRLTLDLARCLMGVPRHLSQHPGGFVLTHDRLDELVPVEPAAMENRQIIEWDKDDIDVLKFMKVDCLALGMLTCMKKGLDLLVEHKGQHFTLATIPAEDARTYAMIRKADTIGVFQIESRAQMSMLPRLKPRVFYDLVIEVAIVRPGPIQGDMVHPYLRRREGLEPEEYPTPELEKVLKKTLGIPLFQEQAMQVAMVCAGFSASEADQLRRAMATFKNTGTVSQFQARLVEGMKDKGYSKEFAERIYQQLEGFGSYGFPESHAASFAILAYSSSWMKCRHPDVFLTSLLNSQPMGFYAPAQLVRDAREHGVEIRPICVNASRWDSTLEGPETGEGRFAVRLGMSLVKGLANDEAARIVIARGAKPFISVDDLWRRVGVKAASLTHLAEADAFRPAFGLARREALWAIRALRDEPLPLFAAAMVEREAEEPDVLLRPMQEGAEVTRDYNRTGMSLRDHPLAFLRSDLREQGIVSCRQALDAKDGHRVTAAGLVLVRQRPGSAEGVVFLTLEDETAALNVIVWPDMFEKYRRVVLSSRMLGVKGRLQKEGEVVHLVAREIIDFSALLADVGNRSLHRVGREQQEPQSEQIVVASRNFH